MSDDDHSGNPSRSPGPAKPRTLHPPRQMQRPRVCRLDASSADALLPATQFPLEPRDVVFVSTYGLNRSDRFALATCRARGR